MGYEDAKADVKKTMREADEKAKETWRRADGEESLSDKAANLGDDIRNELGNAGDNIRRGAESPRGRRGQARLTIRHAPNRNRPPDVRRAVLLLRCMRNALRSQGGPDRTPEGRSSSTWKSLARRPSPAAACRESDHDRASRRGCSRWPGAGAACRHRRHARSGPRLRSRRQSPHRQPGGRSAIRGPARSRTPAISCRDLSRCPARAATEGPSCSGRAAPTAGSSCGRSRLERVTDGRRG